MSDKLIWSSTMTQDYLKGLSDEAKLAELPDYGYDPEMLKDMNLDDVIDNDEYMFEFDTEDFKTKIVPMINKQTNGLVVALNKDNQSDIYVCQPDDLISDVIGNGYSKVEMYDVDGNLEARYYTPSGSNELVLELFAIPEDEDAQKEFVDKIMPSLRDPFVDPDDDDPYLNPGVDFDSPEELEDGIESDKLRQFGTRIKVNMNESYDDFNKIEFPKEEFYEAVNSGIGYDNANKFIKYLANNDYSETGPFGEDPIKNNGGSVRLFSQASDITYTFNDDGGVEVIGTDEELGDLEEYFDTLDDFVKWCQVEALSLGSDVGCYDMERYLSGGEEVEESLNENKSKDPEALAEELAELKEDYADFGAEGFYNIPYDSFKREFPVFTRDVIEDFLIKYASLKESELDDPEVKAAWQDGELIYPDEWSNLFDHAEKQVKGQGPQWKAYNEELDKTQSPEDAKYYRQELDTIYDNVEGLAREAAADMAYETSDVAQNIADEIENKEEIINEGLDNWTDAYKLFTACADRFYPDEEKIREAAQQVYEIFKGDSQVEEAWKRWNDTDSVKEYEETDESLNEDKKAPLKSLLGMSKDDVVLALKDRFGGSHLIKYSEEGNRVDAGEYGYWDGREPAAYYGGVTCWLNDDNTVEVVETYSKSWSKQNESLTEGAAEENAMHDLKEEVSEFLVDTLNDTQWDDNIAYVVQSKFPKYNADWCGEDPSDFYARRVDEVKKSYCIALAELLFENAPRELSESVEEIKEESNVDKLRKHYGNKFKEELNNNPAKDDINGRLHDIQNKLDDVAEIASDAEADTTANIAADAANVLNQNKDIINEEEDYLVVPGDMKIAKELENESLEAKLNKGE